MKLYKILIISTLALLIVSSTAIARDFGWTRDFNIQAKSDPSEFRAKIATRFDLSDMQVMALRNIFASPADAYIMLRFGEIQGVLKKLSKEEGKSAVKKYRSNKSKGWEALADILGVDTDSKDFLVLKHGHDLHFGDTNDKIAYSDHDRNNIN